MYRKVCSVMTFGNILPFSTIVVPTTWEFLVVFFFLTCIIIPNQGMHCMPAEQMVMQWSPEFHPGSLLNSLPALL